MTMVDFGVFSDMPNRLNGKVESLDLRFWTSSIPLKQRWRNNGLSADFLGDYVTTFFPLDDSDAAANSRKAEIKGAVSYVANELLENAMKFSDESCGIPVIMRMFILDDKVMLYESNGASRATADNFKSFIEQITSEDTDELYFRKMEEKAEDPTDGGAGLGFLTMINDYEASLAWRFEQVGDAFLISTQVSISI